ncbi:acyl-CoA dehydrogenase family protein [Saccharopolyspora sp. NPDC050642]|uniref:acyl-CoA dehydrogenase family protein n=1 Tax=Saccharopolyspora sp. NPDC050642 TaxID=3157099 RepID=UPI0033C6A1AB
MTPSLEEFRAEAVAWLQEHAERRQVGEEPVWGKGSDSVSVFRDSSPEQERAWIEALREWQRRKFDAGYGAISWPVEYGGRALPQEYADTFADLEGGFVTPEPLEVASISLNIEAPVVLTVGTQEQKEKFLRGILRADLLVCQLFSEPGAGSDLGSIALRATPDGGSWVLDGQKAWTSGAQFADYGVVIARTSTDLPRQQAMTAFLVPLKAAGVDVRPLRQMTGGSNFNEVFFDRVRIPDSLRLGEVGEGWSVAMTTLGFERASSSRGAFGAFDHSGRLVLLARHLGRHEDPAIRRAIVDLYARNRMRALSAQRAAARLQAGGVPGPEGSIAKLTLTRGLQQAGDIATELLGPALVADTGEWGTYAWSELLCGAPGLRLGGGTDEIQKNTIAERALGLPREPRVEKKAGS